VDNHDEDPELKRFKAFFAEHLLAYIDIAEMLASLPVPIRIAPMNSEWDPRAGVLALDRVRTVIRDLPLPERAQSMINTVILEWLACYDMAAVWENHGSAPWRLDVMEAGLARVMIGLYLVRGLLSE
jgi:hypothetical protein